MGARVTGFSLPPADPEGLPAPPDRNVTSRSGDIRDCAAVRAVFEESRPEIVFHLAAQALVRRSYWEPVATYATNVMGTVHVLEAARHTPSVRVVVIVTSDKCYENREWPWGYREPEPMGGHDPYSSSKGCAELVTAAYRRSFGPPKGDLVVASARAGNVIGGGDWAEDRIVPDIVRALTARRPVVLRHPRAVRPWQHVLEPLSGYLVLGERLWNGRAEFAEAWNFGPAEPAPLSVGELARRFLDLWGGGQLVMQAEDSLHEAHYLKLDCSKALQRLGWFPVLTVDESLSWTAQWYRSYTENRAAAARLTRHQIQDYMERRHWTEAT